MIHKRNIDRATAAFKYFRKTGNIPEVYRTQCFAVANKLIHLIKTNADISEYRLLQKDCETFEMIKFGSGAYELYCTILAIIHELDSG